MFLGTPHTGSNLARWAEPLARLIRLLKQTNPDIVGVLERDSEVLARIQDSFYAMIMSRRQEGMSPIDISCFYEELPLPTVGMVSRAEPQPGPKARLTSMSPNRSCPTIRPLSPATSKSESAATTWI